MVRSACVALVILSLAACSRCGPAAEKPSSSNDFPGELAAQALANYAKIVRASYEDALVAARALDASVNAFTAAPSAEQLDATRKAWRASREPYLQTEVFRFYDGPIDDSEGLLNAWPMDENYVDSVAGNPGAGLINGTGPIDEATLVGVNEQGGEKNIAIGYHAIEFLLWGQDRRADGPGDRPYTDFIEGEASTLANGARRRQYLSVTSALLVKHLAAVNDAWTPDADNYRAAFVAADPREGLGRVLTGMAILSGFETGGERLQTALDTGDQEDEHSCFSDNTHRDMVQDVRGIQNVYLGRYTRADGTLVQGTSIKAVVDAKDAALGARLAAEISDSLTKAEALKPPFDQEILADNPEGNARVSALISALRTQSKTFEEVLRLFELTAPVAQ